MLATMVPGARSSRRGQGGLDRITRQAARQRVGDVFRRLHRPAVRALTGIDQTNVTHLSLAWIGKVTAARVPGGGGGGRGGGGGAGGNVIVGEGFGEFAANSTANIKGAILKVGDMLILSRPTTRGRSTRRHELAALLLENEGGTHRQSRARDVAQRLRQTPDDYLVSIDARTGKERWHVRSPISIFSALDAGAVVVGNHVIVGTGNDLDQPGFLQSFDAETGQLSGSSTRCR